MILNSGVSGKEDVMDYRNKGHKKKRKKKRCKESAEPPKIKNALLLLFGGATGTAGTWLYRILKQGKELVKKELWLKEAINKMMNYIRNMDVTASILGIVVGSGVIITCCVVICYFVYKCKKEDNRTQSDREIYKILKEMVRKKDIHKIELLKEDNKTIIKIKENEKKKQ